MRDATPLSAQLAPSLRSLACLTLLTWMAAGTAAESSRLSAQPARPGPLPAFVDEIGQAGAQDELAEFSRQAFAAALKAQQMSSRAPERAAAQSPLAAGGAAPVVLDWSVLADEAAAKSSIGGTADEPTGNVELPANLSTPCPGFYILRAHPGAVTETGRFGAQVTLSGSGPRNFSGGLNFGGRASTAVRGFSAFNISNAANEMQVVNMGVTVGAAGRIALERRSGSQVLATPVNSLVNAGSHSLSVVVPPGFYVLTFTPTASASATYAVSALTSYVNRVGGGFQGSVVVGGLHDPASAAGATPSTGFASFCLTRSYTAAVKILARPTYGSTGSTGMEFSLTRGDGTVFLDSRSGGSGTTVFAPGDPLLDWQWHLDSQGQDLGGLQPAVGADLNVRPLWQNCPQSGCKGEGVLVAVVDDSLEIRHADLIDNMATNAPHRDFLRASGASNQDPTPTEPGDGHGTSVAGIIAARDNSIGVVGVAPRARLIGLNLLKANSAANDAEAMLHQRALVSVSNNSWGATDGTGKLNPSDDTWKQAIEQGIVEGAGGRGIVYLWAGGNGHDLDENQRFKDYSGIDGQANFHGVLAVAAINADDTRSSYSELGPNLLVGGFGGEFCGNDALTVTTTDIGIPDFGYNTPDAETADIDFSDRRFTRCFNGTSSASPTVAGVVALIRQANPQFTWRDVRWVLANTARRVDPESSLWSDNGAGLPYNLQYGFGAADASASVAAARSMSPLPEYRQEDSSNGATASVAARAQVSRTASFSSDELTVVEYVAAHVDLRGSSESFNSGDLRLILISPSGTRSVLMPQRACSESDEESGETLAVDCESNVEFSFGAVQFLGETANGTWTLEVDNRQSTAGANLAGWSLTLYGHQGE